MDSAVWVTQTVIDQHRREREADAAAHRRVRDGFCPDEASGPGAAPSRRRRRSRPIPAVAVAAAPERTADELELVGAGDER